MIVRFTCKRCHKVFEDVVLHREVSGREYCDACKYKRLHTAKYNQRMKEQARKRRTGK